MKSPAMECTSYFKCQIRLLEIIFVRLRISFSQMSVPHWYGEPPTNTSAVSWICQVSQAWISNYIPQNIVYQSTAYYIDIIMGAKASQITSLTFVKSTVISGAD